MVRGVEVHGKSCRAALKSEVRGTRWHNLGWPRGSSLEAVSNLSLCSALRWLSISQFCSIFLRRPLHSAVRTPRPASVTSYLPAQNDWIVWAYEWDASSSWTLGSVDVRRSVRLSGCMCLIGTHRLSHHCNSAGSLFSIFYHFRLGFGYELSSQNYAEERQKEEEAVWRRQKGEAWSCLSWDGRRECLASIIREREKPESSVVPWFWLSLSGCWLMHEPVERRRKLTPLTRTTWCMPVAVGFSPRCLPWLECCWSFTVFAHSLHANKAMTFTMQMHISVSVRFKVNSASANVFCCQPLPVLQAAERGPERGKFACTVRWLM